MSNTSFHTTISDRRIAVPSGSNLDHYIADVLSSTDYYPFGSPMPGRNSNSADYRFGFNGKENDNEVKGTGNQQDYGMRIYDPRLARFLSADPLIVKEQKYAELSPYQFASNRPIDAIDLDGLEMTSAIINYEYTGSMYGAQAGAGGYKDIHVPERLQRGASGLWKITSGTCTFLGGIAIGAVGSPTIIASVAGFTIAASGGYQAATGFQQFTNAIVGADESADPQYDTPVGAITESKVADAAAGLLLGSKKTNVNAFVDAVNKAGTVQTAVSFVKATNDEIIAPAVNKSEFSDAAKQLLIRSESAASQVSASIEKAKPSNSVVKKESYKTDNWAVNAYLRVCGSH